ncbi:regulator of chromosome condensation [Anaeramoeba ignava]|uniref:Regulator of chromosome condensation n=1 Tax=Anaeramoeba ignava TaxID=1746090 RepID=A0A9Q0RGY0_ANAIG|nr:regulator of chromosome condensation [Anaeramoeba ignava]
MIEVYSWGYGGGLVIHNNNGLLQKIELKIPDRIKQISIGSSRTLILTSNYDVYYLHHQKIEKMEVEKIEKMEVGEKIIKVGASFEHCLCISETGKAYSMGTNTYKQLGHTKVNSGKFELIKFFIEKNIKIRDFAIGCYQSYFITSDNDLYACGYNTDGQIGIFNEPKGIDTPRYITNNISNVYSGDYAFHFFYQTLDGDIFCSGRNGSGQLGIGNKNQINQVQQLFGFENKKIIDIQCGYTQTIIVTEENGVNLVYASGDFSNYLGFSVNYNTKFKLVDFLPKTKILSISTGSRITGILTDEPKLYIISYFSKKSPEMEIEDNDNNSNLKANLSSFKIQCGDERAIIFQQKMSIIQLDLRKFLKRKEFTDISLKTNQGFIQAHKIWIETRIDNKLESLLDCLKITTIKKLKHF